MAKGKRSRDYRAEEARRNEIARSLGFSSRAQMRRALRTGSFEPVRRTANPRSPIIGRADRPDVVVPPKRRGTTIPGIRRQCADWSRRHSQKPTSEYNPGWPDSRVMAYYHAYVDDETRAWKIENGLDSLRDFLVDEMGYYTDDVFDERYGVSSHVFA